MGYIYGYSRHLSVTVINTILSLVEVSAPGPARRGGGQRPPWPLRARDAFASCLNICMVFRKIEPRSNSRRRRRRSLGPLLTCARPTANGTERPRAFGVWRGGGGGAFCVRGDAGGTTHIIHRRTPAAVRACGGRIQHTGHRRPAAERGARRQLEDRRPASPRTAPARRRPLRLAARCARPHRSFPHPLGPRTATSLGRVSFCGVSPPRQRPRLRKLK